MIDKDRKGISRPAGFSSALDLQLNLNRYTEKSKEEYTQVKNAKDATQTIATLLSGVNSNLSASWSDIGTTTVDVISQACSNLEDLNKVLSEFIKDTLENERQAAEHNRAQESELANIRKEMQSLK